MGIIDLIMGWGCISEETPIDEIELKEFEKKEAKARQLASK